MPSVRRPLFQPQLATSLIEDFFPSDALPSAAGVPGDPIGLTLNLNMPKYDTKCYQRRKPLAYAAQNGYHHAS